MLLVTTSFPWGSHANAMSTWKHFPVCTEFFFASTKKKQLNIFWSALTIIIIAYFLPTTFSGCNLMVFHYRHYIFSLYVCPNYQEFGSGKGVFISLRTNALYKRGDPFQIPKHRKNAMWNFILFSHQNTKYCEWIIYLFQPLLLTSVWEWLIYNFAPDTKILLLVFIHFWKIFIQDRTL